MNEEIKLKVGDKITYKYKNKVYNNIANDKLSNLPADKFQWLGVEILKVERPIKYETVYQHKKIKILDDIEKRYLENFLRPFKNDVTNITKLKYTFIPDKEMLAINISLPSGSNKYIDLPYFAKDTMYKGMQLNKQYTLKVLGLFEEK